jgi:cytidylate kinase
MTVIAIDGPAASGKGTLARRLAAHLGFAFLDTGLLYRAVGLAVLRAGGDPSDPGAAARAAHGLELQSLDDPALRDEATAAAASQVAAIPGVRAALLDLQRRFAKAPPRGEPGAVLDGRDIGTVVCPDAEVKIFVTADQATRARRRWLELAAKGEAADLSAVQAEMAERDRRDAERGVAPLAQAADAILLDTTNSDIEAVFKAALRAVEEKIGRSLGGPSTA